MKAKGRVFAASAAVVIVAVLAIVRVSGASADLRPRLSDKNCEDPSEDVPSPDGRFTARYTKEACDYGFGSNSQEAWIDVLSTQKSTKLKVQVLQLVGPAYDLDIIRWRDKSHLEIDTSWPLDVKRSLHQAGPVTVIYVATASHASVAHGKDYEIFAAWARRNAENGVIAKTAACSRYKGGLLREPC